MDFEEFCAAALSVHQLEALDHCEQHARCELGFGPSIPLHVVLYDWIRHTDGNLDLLYGVSSQIFVKAQFGDLARWPIYSLLWHTMNEASLPIGGEGFELPIHCRCKLGYQFEFCVVDTLSVKL
ncbi:unnamed protein product [Prunus armeniaca]|uniref:Uncharacterized protein n=1 Tax=Prunus armeniaca TaxID=36596 RepID=A0A6J5VS08_PRUAR|nr:unnamed protein product [Prunus armeniaca]